MLRLTLVFLLWLASTAHSIEDAMQDAVQDADRHWLVYRQLGHTNLGTIFARDHGCGGPLHESKALKD